MTTWIENLLNSPRRASMPIMTHPGIEEIHRTVLDAVTDGEIHYQAIKTLADLYNMDACTVIMDLTVEAEAFGSKIAFSDNEVPSVTERLVSDEASIRALNVPDLSKGRIPEYLKANRLAAENIKDRPVFSGCIGPFSLAGRLYDMSEIMVAIYIEPDAIKLLLEKCSEFIYEYCKALKDLHVTGIIMAEPAAGLLSNEDCMAFSTDYIKPIIDRLQDDHFTFILHNCGNTGQCTQAMLNSGAAALHFGNAINMVDTLKECPDDRLIMGNINPVQIMKQSTPEEVYSATSRLLKETREYKNFILSTGCDVPPHTPKKNILAFKEALNRYNSNI